MTTLLRTRVILNIIRTSTASVLARAHAVSNGMAADPKLFSAPTPTLATIDAQIIKVDGSEQLASTRAKGAAAARDVERLALVGMLETERAYVQMLCDAAPGQAVAIIEAAGMVVAPVAAHDNPILKVKPGAQPGSADLDANVAALAGRTGKKAFFNWQWTTDGGATFHTAPTTPHGKTTITGLTPLTMVGFRVSVTNIQGQGEWTPMVTILIL